MGVMGVEYWMSELESKVTAHSLKTCNEKQDCRHTVDTEINSEQTLVLSHINILEDSVKMLSEWDCEGKINILVLQNIIAENVHSCWKTEDNDSVAFFPSHEESETFFSPEKLYNYYKVSRYLHIRHIKIPAVYRWYSPCLVWARWCQDSGGVAWQGAPLRVLSCDWAMSARADWIFSSKRSPL